MWDRLLRFLGIIDEEYVRPETPRERWERIKAENALRDPAEIAAEDELEDALKVRNYASKV